MSLKKQSVNFETLSLVSPRIDVWGAVTEENSILMTSYWWRVTTHANLGSASNWSCRVRNLLQPIRSTSLIWGSNTPSVWNFFARFSEVISVIWRKNQWWRRQLSAVFSLFSNWRLCLGIEIVFCRLLLRMARIDVDWNLKMLNQIFMFIWC